MKVVKSMESALADKEADKFARRRSLALNDPIVQRLRNGIKMVLGYRRWRNGIEADRKARMGPGLFDSPQTPATSLTEHAGGNAGSQSVAGDKGGTE